MKLVIGQWLVDSSENLITNTQTEKVSKLEPRAMAVLHYFAKNPGKVISLNELIEQVWEGRVVGDHAIYRVINQIRKALDPDNKNTYLTTIAKKGYKLIQPVKEVVEQQINSDDIGSAVTVPENTNQVVSGLAKYAIFFGLVCLSVYALWAIVLAKKWDYYSTPLYSKVDTFNSDDYYEDFPKFSRDGEFVVYSRKNSADSSFNIFLRHIKSKNTQQLTDDDFDWENSVVSNQAKELVSVRKSEDSCMVISFSLENNAYKQRDLFTCEDNNLLDIDISDDGSTLYFTCQEQANQINRIFTYQLKTGKRSQLTNYLDTNALGDYLVTLSPDNNRLAFLRSAEFGSTQIGIIDLVNDESKIVTEIDTWIRSMTWLPDNNALVYQTDSHSIFKYSLVNDYSKPIVTSPAEIRRSTHSGFENLLAVVQQDTQFGIWRIQNPFFENDTGDVLEKKLTERLMLSDSLDYYPVFANLSERVAFVSDRSGSLQVWIREEDGTLRQVTNFTDGRLIHHLSWSSDDMYIASSTASGSVLMLVNTINGEITKLTDEEAGFKTQNPTWSIDSQTVYFGAIVEKYSRALASWWQW